MVPPAPRPTTSFFHGSAVLGPEHAATLRDGLARDVKQFLEMPDSSLTLGGDEAGDLNAAPAGLVAGDTEHIGIADHPEDIIVVVGGPGIHPSSCRPPLAKGRNKAHQRKI